VYADKEARQPCSVNKNPPSLGENNQVSNFHKLVGGSTTTKPLSVLEQSYSIAVEEWTLYDTMDTVAAVESRPINVAHFSQQEISTLCDSASIGPEYFGSIDSQESFRILPKELARYASSHAETTRGRIQRIKPRVSRGGQSQHRYRFPQKKVVQAYSSDESFGDEQEPLPSILYQSLKTCLGGVHGTAENQEQNKQRVLDSLRKKAASGLFQAALACHTPDLQETSFLTASTGQSSLPTKRPAWDSLFEQYLDFVESSFLNERKAETRKRKPPHIIHRNDSITVSSAMEVSQWSHLIELNSIVEEPPQVEITLDTLPMLELTGEERVLA
jgi:hypothetical protein